MKTIYFPGTGDIQAIQFTKGELLSQPCDYTLSFADLLARVRKAKIDFSDRIQECIDHANRAKV